MVETAVSFKRSWASEITSLKFATNNPTSGAITVFFTRAATFVAYLTFVLCTFNLIIQVALAVSGGEQNIYPRGLGHAINNTLIGLLTSIGLGVLAEISAALQRGSE